MKLKSKSIFTAILVIIALVSYFFLEDRESAISRPSENEMGVYFIDVGQADSTLFIFPDGKTLLIDAGNEADEKTVIDFIKGLDIKRLDYVVATHPHEDHIGCMSEVLSYFDIGTFYMSAATHTTRYFENMLDVLENKNVEVKKAKAGDVAIDGEYSIKFYSPEEKEYNDLNAYSVVTKVAYKNKSFLITGDTITDNEVYMRKTFGDELKADVLRVAHHGSSTSSTNKFLDTVSPGYAVISVGVDNDYGHPHAEILNKIEKRNIEILRTDEMGSISFITDGENISYKVENEIYGR